MPANLSRRHQLLGQATCLSLVKDCMNPTTTTKRKLPSTSSERIQTHLISIFSHIHPLHRPFEPPFPEILGDFCSLSVKSVWWRRMVRWVGRHWIGTVIGRLLPPLSALLASFPPAAFSHLPSGVVFGGMFGAAGEGLE